MVQIGGTVLKEIDYEIRLLLEMSRNGALSGYPESTDDSTFYAENVPGTGMREYFSGENDAMERNLKVLWTDEAQMRKCIPLILAAVEKSRGEKSGEVLHTELYNYTM